MANYEAASLTTIVTAAANTPIAALRANARRMFVYEIGLSASTAPTTSGGLGLCWADTIGTGGLTGVLGEATDGSDTADAVGQIVTAWATAAPTALSRYMRRVAFGPAIGVGVVFAAPPDRPWIVQGSGARSELVITNLQGTAPGTWQIYAVWSE